MEDGRVIGVFRRRLTFALVVAPCANGCTIRYGPANHRSLFGYSNQNILFEVEEDRKTLFRIVTRDPKSHTNCTCYTGDEV